MELGELAVVLWLLILVATAHYIFHIRREAMERHRENCDICEEVEEGEGQ